MSQHMRHNQQITVKLKAPSDHKNTMIVPDDVQGVFSPVADLTEASHTVFKNTPVK